jgi:large conductance mechanosensitive channel
MLKEFREFILRGNVVDLAVAVVIGTAFGLVVQSLVKDIFTPLIAAIFGEPDFSALTFTINGSQFFYGNFINALIAFLSVATVIFFVVVKPLNLLHERRKKAEATAEPAAPAEDVRLLTEIRDLLAQGNTPSRPT